MKIYAGLALALNLVLGLNVARADKASEFAFLVALLQAKNEPVAATSCPCGADCPMCDGNCGENCPCPTVKPAADPLPWQVPCNDCGASGMQPGGNHPCYTCGGTGRVIQPSPFTQPPPRVTPHDAGVPPPRDGQYDKSKWWRFSKARGWEKLATWGGYAQASEADAQPTPMEGVTVGLRALNPQSGEVLKVLGSGFDARWEIVAARDYGVQQVIGVEIDPAIADSARRYVEHAGLSGRIQIVTGDAAAVNAPATIGAAYLWPDDLAKMRPLIEREFARFVSYAWPVPGLNMQAIPVGNGANVYLWRRPPAVTTVPIARTVRQTVRLPQGSWCQVCGRNCSNPMAHRLQQQIIGYRTVATGASRQSAGHYEKRCRIVNGRKQCFDVWVPN